MSVEEFRLDLPDRADFVSVARVFVAAVGTERAQLPHDRVDDLTIAVSEACTNAIEAYHREGMRDGRIRLRCVASPGRLEVDVDDDGPGFGPDEVVLTAVEGSVTGMSSPGRGLALIFALVDEAELRATKGGTSVRLLSKS
jgi:anti-sigma regulatory factor (Ser/Thr protein kinase)